MTSESSVQFTNRLSPFTSEVSVAQPDRASDFGSEGCGFESLQARHWQSATYANFHQVGKKVVCHLPCHLRRKVTPNGDLSLRLAGAPRGVENEKVGNRERLTAFFELEQVIRNDTD